MFIYGDERHITVSKRIITLKYLKTNIRHVITDIGCRWESSFISSATSSQQISGKNSESN